ncbi:YajQ family cyclic di-GMP-binding protein [Haliea sp.]
MPSFDVVSEVDLHQLTNAVDQVARIIGNRFDFKGVDAGFEREERTVVLHAEAEFQLTQMEDMLRSALIKCEIDPEAMECGEPSASGKQVRQSITLRHGLDSQQCKTIVKTLKDAKLKVQAQIQGDQVRVTGKKRDDLQQAIALLRESPVGLPLQFSNFRD